MPGVSLDIWCVIASYCDTKDILSLFLLNKAINRLSNYRPLYQMICNRHNIEIRPGESLLEMKYKLNIKLMSAYEILFHNCDFADFAKCAFWCGEVSIKTGISQCMYNIILRTKNISVRFVFGRLYDNVWLDVFIRHKPNECNMYSLEWGNLEEESYCSPLDCAEIINKGLNFAHADTMNEVIFLKNYFSNEEICTREFAKHSMSNYHKYQKLLPPKYHIIGRL